ncbi:hypothetical protein OBBRIDRAFT_117603 [Obba rivulosa]|uniref:F-box domain-containing protein n=1 Tax=Obba rivulosa TaxID=1052685 RepID=A0A8E2ARE2_9APHY|nr:hypothetical protein OBBRIDRAFT_117603 [Obba rivulosa]
MHRTLQIPELLRLVFEEVYVDNDFCWSTLAALVRTCRIFHDVGIRILWYHLPHLGPLILCFPSDVLEVFYGPHEQVVCLARPPNAQDWSRFMHYAAHVQCLSVEDSGCFTRRLSTMRVAPGVYMTLHVYKPVEHVLPNLSELSWCHGSGLDRQMEDLQSLRLALGPKVDTLLIKCFSKLDDALVLRYNQTLEDFIRDAPVLHCVTFIGTQMHSSTQDLAPRLLQKQYRLRVFSMCTGVGGRMSAQTLLCLSQLPMLHAATFQCGELTAAEKGILSSTQALYPPSFPSLQTATFFAQNAADCAPVLGLAATSRLRDLRIDTFSAPRASELRQLFSDIVKDYADLLDTLVVSSMTPASRSDTSYTITPDVLQPLFALKNVVHISIAPRCPIKIDDATVKDIAKAWPQIRILNLGIHGRRFNNAQQVTLKSLMSLAQHCRNLQDLGLSFDTAVGPISEAYDEQHHLLDGLCNRRLSVLRVCTSKLPERRDDVEVLTRFLADVFPKLKKIHTAWINSLDFDALDREQDFEDPGWDEEWAEVNRSLVEICAIRKLERRQVAPQVK